MMDPVEVTIRREGNQAGETSSIDEFDIMNIASSELSKAVRPSPRDRFYLRLAEKRERRVVRTFKLSERVYDFNSADIGPAPYKRPQSGLLELGRRRLEQSLEAKTRILGEQHPCCAETLVYLARLFSLYPASGDEREHCFQRACEILSRGRAEGVISRLYPVQVSLQDCHMKEKVEPEELAPALELSRLYVERAAAARAQLAARSMWAGIDTVCRLSVAACDCLRGVLVASDPLLFRLSVDSISDEVLGLMFLFRKTAESIVHELRQPDTSVTREALRKQAEAERISRVAAAEGLEERIKNLSATFQVGNTRNDIQHARLMVLGGCVTALRGEPELGCLQVREALSPGGIAGYQGELATLAMNWESTGRSLGVHEAGVHALRIAIEIHVALSGAFSRQTAQAYRSLGFKLQSLSGLTDGLSSWSNSERGGDLVIDREFLAQAVRCFEFSRVAYQRYDEAHPKSGGLELANFLGDHLEYLGKMSDGAGIVLE